MKKIVQGIFLVVVVLVFGALVAFQGYFFFFPQAVDEARAQRLGGEIVDLAQSTQAVDKEEEGLFTFLTFETEKGKASSATLLVNAAAVGDFKGGILSIKVNDGDEISIVGGVKGDRIYLLERPDILDPSFPSSLAVGGGEKNWGIVSFK